MSEKSEKTSAAEQQAITPESGAVYAELPDFDSGDEPIWEAVFNWKAATPGSDAHKKAMAVESAIINSLRDFADRTHALRMQAAPKAAPGEPDPADIIAGALQISRGHAIEMMREALEAAPQQEAPKAAPGERCTHCGDAKELHNGLRCVNGTENSYWAAPQQEAQEPVAWFTDWHPDGRKYARKPHGFNELGAILDDPDLIREVWKPLYTAPQPAPVVGRMSPSKEWLETRLAIADDSDVQAGVPSKNARPCDAPPGCNSHNCLECNDYPRAGGVQALSAAPAVTSEQRRLIGVIADKIEDGTLFQSGIYPKKDLARFVRNMLDATPTAPAASPTPPAEQQATKETSGGFHVWRDISTAPKDGSRFVAIGYNYGLYSEGRHICVAQWFRGCWMETSDWNEASELQHLTHWLPLPSPPDNAAELNDLDVSVSPQQAAPKAAQGEPSNWPEICDGKEQEMWEAWALRNKYDMRQHPLHYLFLHPETNAARRGWKAGLQYAVDQMRKAAPQQEAQEPMAHDEDLLERLYWEFDAQRKKTGEERLTFKRKMRFYASEFRRLSMVKIAFTYSVSDEMMNLADRLGSESDDVDLRAWKHLLVYAPQPAPAPLSDREEIAMVDAAMVEMANIVPPLKRSECARLIRAALAAQGGKV